MRDPEMIALVTLAGVAILAFISFLICSYMSRRL